MIAIIGLGNPEPRYFLTRHNIGFMVVDELARRNHLKTNYRALNFTYQSSINLSQKVLYVKPQTYMNLSGEALARLFIDFPGLDIKNIVVISDDLNLPFGSVRLRKRGSDGGQNGLKSIIDRLGHSEFARLRIGIGNSYDNVINFVLGQFSADEQKNLGKIIAHCADAVQSFVENGIEQTMSRYNGNLLE